MSKLVGCFLLLLTAYWYSYVQQKREKEKLNKLFALCKLFDHTQKNISYFHSSLGEIFQTYADPILENCGFLPLWREHRLMEAIDCISDLYPTSVIQTLQQYALHAGKGYIDEEVRLCTYTHDVLEETCQKQCEEQKTKNKMYKTLPYLLVISIVLLLY